MPGSGKGTVSVREDLKLLFHDQYFYKGANDRVSVKEDLKLLFHLFPVAYQRNIFVAVKEGLKLLFHLVYCEEGFQLPVSVK